MATPEQKEAARQRKANQRARDKGLPEPYAGPSLEKGTVSEREARYRGYLTFAKAQDATGQFYKSECRSTLQLLAIFEGNNNVGVEDSEIRDSKTGKKKQNTPNPSIQAVRIPAIKIASEDGQMEPIDPDNPAFGRTMEVSKVLTFHEWLEFRDRARKDLFWLASLLGRPMFYKTHKPICDMFIQKNFDGLYFPNYTRNTVSGIIAKHGRFSASGSPCRTAIILAPRSGGKSTLDGMDAVQWLLNAPDIRIMIITAFRNLSRQFLKEIKEYFYLAPRGEATAFQLLFPEYILTGVDGRSREPIECPAAVLKTKEPHIWVTSMESSITGQRCDICKADDIVDPKNSTDEILREGLIEKFNGAVNLTEPWGFIEIIGTRYFTDDYYGTRMLPDEDGVVAPHALLRISAWTPKPEYKIKYELLLEQPNGMSQVTEEMVDLWYPFKLNFAVLRRKLLDTKERNSSNIQKERNFRNQYLNIPTDPIEITDLTTHFSRDVLRSHTYGKSAMPKTGEKIVCIDWGYSKTASSDYSVLAAVLKHQREDGTYELVVEDIDYDKWKASELVVRIILFLKKHDPTRVLLERANGYDLLIQALDLEAARQGRQDLMQKIFPTDTDNSKNAKTNRIKTLEILLADDRLHFVAGTWIDELYRQFERFTGETKKGRKDDIPDAISFASRTLPITMFRTSVIDTEEADIQAEEDLKRLAKEDHYRTYFGESAFSSTIKNAPRLTEHAPTWRERATGVRKDAPVTIVEETPQKPPDPRLRIFGNKGPWRL